MDKMDNIHIRDTLPGTHPDSRGEETSKEKEFQEKKLNNAHKHLACSSFTRNNRSFRVRCSYADFGLWAVPAVAASSGRPSPLNKAGDRGALRKGHYK